MTDLRTRGVTTESFAITVSESELDDAWSALMSMLSGDGLAQRVWLFTTGANRLWVVGEMPTSVWLRSQGDAKDPDLMVPLAPQFLRQASILADVAGECEISLDSINGVLAARTATEFFCVDYEECDLFDPDWLPESHAAGGVSTVSALVDGTQISRVMGGVRAHPPAVPIDVVPPFVALEMSGLEFKVTVDWRRSGGVRYTHVVPTEQQVSGEGRVSFLGYFAARFLTDRMFSSEESVAISFPSDDPEFIRFDSATGQWGCIVHVDRESAVRWHTRVCAELLSAGYDVDGLEERPSNTVNFRSGDVEMTALIEPGVEAVDDKVRLVTVLARGVPENLDILREINSFNQRWSEVKVVLEKSTLFGMVDVRCTELDRIGPAAHVLVDRHLDLTPMLSVYF